MCETVKWGNGGIYATNMRSSLDWTTLSRRLDVVHTFYAVRVIGRINLKTIKLNVCVCV